MDSEWSYRVALLGLAAVFVPVGLYHRLKAATGERLRRRDEGLFVMIGLRLCGLAGLVGVVAFLAGARWLGWARMELPAGVRWAGLPIGIAGAVWTAWMFRTLGSNLTDTVTVRAKATLVTGGPYRWVRHPLYVGVALMMVATTLLSASAWVAVAGSLTVALLLVRSRTEEAQLEARFGQAYRDYRSRTGFVLPRLVSPR